jgi:hypothetical protein
MPPHSKAAPARQNIEEALIVKFKHLLATPLSKTVIALMATAMTANSALCQEPHWPVRDVTKPGVVTTGQSITPAGTQSVFSGRVHAAMFGRSNNVIYVALSTGLVYKLDWRANKVLRVIHGGRNPGLQGMALDPATGDPLMSGVISFGIGRNAETVIQLLGISAGGEKIIANRLGAFAAGQVSAASEKNATGERLAGIALTFNDSLAVVDLATGKVKGTVKTGIAPFGVKLNRAGTVAPASPPTLAGTFKTVENAALSSMNFVSESVRT